MKWADSFQLAMIVEGADPRMTSRPDPMMMTALARGSVFHALKPYVVGEYARRQGVDADASIKSVVGPNAFHHHHTGLDAVEGFDMERDAAVAVAQFHAVTGLHM